jgi:hypothetical protein
MAKRRWIAAAMVTLAFPTVALADSNGSPRPSVLTEGTIGANRFHVEAQIGPDGNAQGNVFVYDNSAKASYKANVLCISVQGNTARILGRITDIKTPGPTSFQGGGVMLRVVDNGKDENNPTDTVGNFLYTAAQSSGFESCNYPVGPVGTKLDHGDVRVDPGTP